MAFTRRKCLSLSELIALGSVACQCWQSALTSSACLPFPDNVVLAREQLSFRNRSIFLSRVGPHHQAKSPVRPSDNRGANEKQEVVRRVGGTWRRLSCRTSGRMLLKICWEPALFKKEENRLHPHLKQPKWVKHDENVLLILQRLIKDPPVEGISGSKLGHHIYTWC